MNHLVKSEEIKKVVLENISGMEKLEKCIMAAWLIKTSGGSKKSVSVEVWVHALKVCDHSTEYLVKFAMKCFKKSK